MEHFSFWAIATLVDVNFAEFKSIVFPTEVENLFDAFVVYMTSVLLILVHNVRLSLSLLLLENAEKLSILLSGEFLVNFKRDGYHSDDDMTCELSEEEDLLSNNEASVQDSVRSPEEEALIQQGEEILAKVKQKAQELRSLLLHVKEAGLGSTETPNVDEWDVQETQYTNSKISLLPESPSCPFLLKLFLQGNSNLTVIPVEFFNCMPLLEVLDLSSTSIKALPPSISKLVALQAFYLRDCELLMELPPEVGALKSLQEFDLKGTELICLPLEIGELVELWSLKFSLYRYADQCEERKGIKMIIPQKSLSKLTRLRELSIDVDPDGEWWDSVVEALLDELRSLVNLEILDLYLPTVELLGKLLRLPCCKIKELPPNILFRVGRVSLSDFRLVVGRAEQHFLSRLPHELEQKCKRLRYCLICVNIDDKMGQIPEALWASAGALILDRHWTIQKLSDVITARNTVLRLEFCLLVDCNELETVFHSSDAKLYYYYLRFLGIYHAKSLKSIGIPENQMGDFMLQKLALHTCPELTTVFPLDVIDSLYYLEELVVEECPKITSLVSAGKRSFSTPLLSGLKKLSLLHLRELSSISSGLPMGGPVEAMLVYNCPKLIDINEVAEMNTVIEGEREWWDRLQWTDRQPSTSKPIDSVGKFFPLKEDGALMDRLKQVPNSILNYDGNGLSWGTWPS